MPMEMLRLTQKIQNDLKAPDQNYSSCSVTTSSKASEKNALRIRVLKQCYGNEVDADVSPSLEMVDT